MKTIAKIQQLLGTSDEVLSELIEQPTAALINQKIIGSLMLGISSERNAVQFCDVMENLVESISSTTHIEIFRNGMEKFM